jgi:hypothetical protein
VRRRRILLAIPLTLVFVVVAVVAARFLTAENRERDAITALLNAEAQGHAGDVAARLESCPDACLRRLEPMVARLHGPGDVRLVRLDSGTSYSLGRSEGWSRVVWVRGVDGRPVVQCVRVRRTGGPLTERSVTLLRLTAPLADNEDSC